MTPPKIPKTIAKMSSSPVISISARKRGTTRFLIGSTPSTWRASSSSRIFRAPRSAVIAVPATPATTTAVTNGANSRIEARTKNPPRRSSAPNSDRKFAAWSPGAPNPNATVEISIGNQVSWSANRNWPMNSPPYGYGGLTVEAIVFPVRIIMFPTCSNSDLAGKNALSAKPLTMSPPGPGRPGPQATGYFIALPCATANPSGGPRVPWYVPRALGERGQITRGRGLMRVGATIATGVTVLVLAACGGAGERQDESEPEAEFPVDVATAKFPNRQRLAEATELRLGVENTGTETIPDLAVTIFIEDGGQGSFDIRLDQPGLANPNRPVWVLEDKYPRLAGESRPPGSSPGVVAQTNTFAFGPLEPGEEREIVWRVTPVRGGTYTVNYEIAAGLQGNAKAVTAGGGGPRGKFVVTISTKPPKARVN